MKSKLIQLTLPIILMPALVGCNHAESTVPSYNISFLENEHAYAVNLPEKATAGSKVQFNVAAEPKYEITDVSANTSSSTVELIGDVSTGFTFTMPAADVKIDAKTIYAGYEISFEGDDYVYTVDLPQNSAAGKEIRFQVAAVTGHEVDEVTAFSGETPIELTGNPYVGFTFTMPASNVVVKAKSIEVTNFNISANSETLVLKTYVEEEPLKIGNFIAGYRIGNVDISDLSTSANVGDTVYVLVNKLAICKNVKVFANGFEATHVELEIKDSEGQVVDVYNAYEFVMPSRNVDITMSAEENEFTVDVSFNCPNIGTAVIRNKDGDITNTFKSGKGVYVTVEIDESKKNDYEIASVTANYESFNGYSLVDPFAATIRLSETEKGNNIYKYLILVNTFFSDDKIHIEVELAETGKYAGKEFLGDYKGFKVSESGLTPPSLVDAKSIKISADGTFKEDWSSNTISNVDETNKTFSIMSGPIGKTVHYDTDMIWYPYTSSKDAVIGWKKWNETTSFKTSGSFANVALIELLDTDGTTVLNNFLRLNGVNYTNVEIEYEGPVAEDIAECKFRVKKDGVVITSYGLE